MASLAAGPNAGLTDGVKQRKLLLIANGLTDAVYSINVGRGLVTAANS